MSNYAIRLEEENRAMPTSPYYSFDTRDVNAVIHYHEELELAYVHSGSVLITGERASFLLKEGELCFFLPLELHNITTPDHSLCWIIKFLPLTGEDSEYLKQFRLKHNVISHTDPDYDDFMKQLSTIKKECDRKAVGSRLSVLLALGQLQLLLLRQKELLPLTISHHRKLTTHYHLIDSVNQLLEKDYPEPLCLESVAQTLGFSKYYFAHKFKQITGMTFLDYLIRFRLQKARQLLSSKTLTITAIAFHCGFGSLRNFNRSFRQVYNMTPSEYLKSLP